MQNKTENVDDLIVGANDTPDPMTLDQALSLLNGQTGYLAELTGIASGSIMGCYSVIEMTNSEVEIVGPFRAMLVFDRAMHLAVGQVVEHVRAFYSLPNDQEGVERFFVVRGASGNMFASQIDFRVGETSWSVLVTMEAASFRNVPGLSPLC